MLIFFASGMETIVTAKASSATFPAEVKKTDMWRGPDNRKSLRPMAAFAAAFRNLPDEVSLWSKRNIYQFVLFQGTRVLRGSFSLDAADRARGRIGFDLHGALGPPGHRGWRFGRDDGVKITRVTPALYVVHFNRKAVVFRLSEPSVPPPGAALIRGGETYLGAVEDQTGLGFFLIRQAAGRRVFYTLDEARLNEDLEPVPVSGQIRIGARSGFAYYRDRYLPRWILIGVRKGYAAHDSLYDGPFARKGRPDNFAGSGAGVLVQPYMLYNTFEALSAFDQCAARAGDPENYYRCFASHQKR